MLKILFLLSFFTQCYSAGINFRGKQSALIVDGGSLELRNNLTVTEGIFENTGTSAASITGAQTIDLVNATFKSSTTELFGKSQISTTGTDSVTMNNGDYLNFAPGTLTPALSVANGATATIYGQPNFSSAIALGNASSILKLQISTPLNQNVTGSGTLFLQDDLRVSSGVSLPSLVNLNGKRLTLNGGTYSSAVTFSGGGNFLLQGDTTISAAWTIGSGSESYTINGQGSTLNLTAVGAISYNGTSGSLTLQNMRLVVSQVDSFKNLQSGGKIVLDNVTLVQSAAGCTISTGNLDLKGYVKVTGQKSDGTKSIFTFSSTGGMVLKPSSTLHFDYTTKFKYNSSNKKLFFFEALTSEMIWDGCDVDTGTEGLWLESGILTVMDKVSVVTSTTAGKELELLNTMDINITKGGNLSTNGTIKYRTNPPLTNSDFITLRHYNYNYYLSTVVSPLAGSFTKDLSARWTCDGLNNGSNFVDCRIVQIFTLRLNTSSAAPVSTPRPPFYLAEHAGIPFGAGGSAGRIVKVGSPTGTQFYHGDIVTFSWHLNNDAYLASSNVDYSGYKEVYTYYNGVGTTPPGNDHYWIIEKY